MTAPNLEPCAWCAENGAWLDKRVCCSNRACPLHNLTMTPQEWNTRPVYKVVNTLVPSGLTEEEKEALEFLSAFREIPSVQDAADVVLTLVRRLSVAPAQTEPPCDCEKFKTSGVHHFTCISKFPHLWPKTVAPAQGEGKLRAAAERVIASVCDTDGIPRTIDGLISWGERVEKAVGELRAALASTPSVPQGDAERVPMVLYCPAGHQHIDEGEWATKPHKTHKCQHVTHLTAKPTWDPVICGLEWRPADFPTVGVAALHPTPSAEKPAKEKA